MSELKLMKIITPDVEAVFLGKEPLKENKLKTPTELAHVIPLDKLLRRAGIFNARVQALRALGYRESQEFPNGLLVATKQVDEVRRLFGANVAEPQDELCGEVFANTIDRGHPNLAYLRIERVRLELLNVTPDQLDEFRRSVDVSGI